MFLIRAKTICGLSIALTLLAGCAAGPPRGDDAFRVRADLVYASRDGQDLYADVYIPTAPGRKPGVVMIHGGGWYKGERAQMAAYCEILARRGFVVANVGYRFAPEFIFPAQLHDVKEAVRWLRANAEQFELDPDALAAYGYSAGAHLALLLALTTPDDGLEGDSRYPGVSSRVQAAIAGGAPTDLAGFEPNETIEDFLGAPPDDEHLPRYRRASPVSYIDADSPPLFLYHGRHDWIVPIAQTEQLYRLALDAGVDVEYQKTFFGHVATYFLAADQADAAAAFLRRVLGR